MRGNLLSRWSNRPRRCRKGVHEWFGFSYFENLVMPRLLLQSMPPKWQADFVRLLDEYQTAFAHIEQPEYRVDTGEWVYVEECTPEMLAAAGVTCFEPEMTSEQAMQVVERYLVARGVGWEFTMDDLHEALGATVKLTLPWFLLEPPVRLLRWGLIEPVLHVDRRYRTTKLVEPDAVAARGGLPDLDLPEPTYYQDGHELRPTDRVFIPGPDPLPYYDRGRGHVEPYGGDTR
jgi:hypothetical protein